MWKCFISLAAQISADFLEFTPIIGSTSITHVSTGPGTSTSITVSQCNLTRSAFGEPAVVGYEIETLTSLFLVSSLAMEPKEGDTIQVGSNVYQVTDVELIRRNVIWRVTASRAFIQSAYATSVTLQRATLGVDVAGGVTETWGTVGTYSAIEMLEDDVADMIDRLGVAGDKQATTYFVAQTVAVLPMDRLLVGGRKYRITMIGDQGRIARLLKIRVELYA